MEEDVFILVIVAAVALIIVFSVFKEREKAKVREAAQKNARESREQILNRPTPPDIERDMGRFISAGFFGEEQSPLAYVGYRVGKTNGLQPEGRMRRLDVCFRTEIPAQLSLHYRSWGRPATYQRYAAIIQHLTRQADLRRSRANYERAVSDWDADAAWFRSEFKDLAFRFRQNGFER